jgi:hypothetical protein
MTSKRAESISVGELPGKLEKAVQSALTGSRFAGQRVDIRFLPHPGIIGFVLSDAVVADRSFSELSKLASDVVTKVPDLAGKAEPAILKHDGGIIMGFFPTAEVELRA